jgi:hypothetical protein
VAATRLEERERRQVPKGVERLWVNTHAGGEGVQAWLILADRGI